MIKLTGREPIVSFDFPRYGPDGIESAVWTICGEPYGTIHWNARWIADNTSNIEVDKRAAHEACHWFLGHGSEPCRAIDDLNEWQKHEMQAEVCRKNLIN